MPTAPGGRTTIALPASAGGGGGANAAAASALTPAQLSQVLGKDPRILGTGAFGNVLAGTLPDGRLVAVKQMELASAAEQKKKDRQKSGGRANPLRRDVSKNETFWHDSDPWRIFSTSSRGLWAFPRALTYIYGNPTSFVVEPACATVTSPQSEV